RLAGLLRLRFIGQFTGGLARSTSPTRYAGKNWPASGALRAASSLPHTGSKRCAFGSDVPSDSPGTLIHRNASTFGAGVARGRSPRPAPFRLHQLPGCERIPERPLRLVSITNVLPVMPAFARSPESFST